MIPALVRKYESRGVAVDANLLLLLVVGNHDHRLIREFKRTKAYALQDYYLLVSFLRHFRKVAAIPNALTEVSNLGAALSRRLHFALFDTLESLIQMLTEEYIESASACQMASFRSFGLTDAALEHVGRSGYLVLTDDFPLYAFLQGNGVDAVNFNHLRGLSWLGR